ncbi:CD109 antigen-like [Oratosquilla oratoria]|uniref:CD109 antigen-like n=1 Tax=Oratosquilla oratoria TaxID=337810 RepID=UPI003F759049
MRRGTKAILTTCLYLLLVLLLRASAQTESSETKEKSRGWRTLPPRREGHETRHHHDYFSGEDRGTRTNNTYIVVAPHVVRPDSVYRVEVTLLQGNAPLDVEVALAGSSSKRQVGITKDRIAPGYSRPFLIETPKDLQSGNLTLSVTGYKSGSKVLVFKNSTQVASTSKFLTILVEMARSAYTLLQVVEFRVVLLRSNNLPYEEPVDIYVHNSAGYIIKRWVSAQASSGVISLSLKTSSGPLVGWWKVRVVARSQVEEYPFYMQPYFIPHIEAFVDMPFTHLADADAITGTAVGKFANAKDAEGNATLELYVRKDWRLPGKKSDFKKVDTKTFFYVNGPFKFSFPMSVLPKDEREDVEVKVDFTFFEAHEKIKTFGYSKTRIVSNKLDLRFINKGEVVFKPGMPFKSAVSVTYSDFEPLDESRLEAGSLFIRASVNLKQGGSRTLPEIHVLTKNETRASAKEFKEWWMKWDRNNTKYLTKETLENEDEVPESLSDFLYMVYAEEIANTEFRKTGIYKFVINVPEEATTLSLSALYKDTESVSASLKGVAHHSPKERYIHVDSSNTDDVAIGSFAVFHVRANFAMDKFRYAIMAKSLLLYTATEEVMWTTGSVATLSVAVSSHMSPRFTFLVYHVTPDGEVLSDAIAVPVKNIGRSEASLVINQHKDHSKKTVEVTLGAKAGANFALSCMRADTYLKHTSDMTYERIISTLHKMESSPRSVHTVVHKSRDGKSKDRLVALQAHSYGRDPLQVFQQEGLVVLTDAKLHTERLTGQCDWASGFLECGDGSCYRREELCDAIEQCTNGVDELGCKKMASSTLPDFVRKELTDEQVFRLRRRSPWRFWFDYGGGWCWKENFIGHKGIEELTLKVPRTKAKWTVQGYAIHPKYGLAIVPNAETYLSHPPFYMFLEAPKVCRRGEQISIRAMLFSSISFREQVMLIIPASKNYNFVHVERDGRVSHFYPRTSTGEQHHLVFLEPHETREVLIPLAVKKQSGNLKVVLRAVMQGARDEASITVKIKPEGVTVRKHTSHVIDLKNRALVYEFFDIPMDESPIIPKSLVRRYIFGSPQATISISGDVFGPTSPLIKVPFTKAFNGKVMKSNDGLIFNFGATLWAMHYLRYTTRLDMKKAKKAFAFINVQWDGMLRRYKKGGFTMWHDSMPSVWVTAHMVKIFLLTKHEDWENYLYIEPKIINECVDFLIDHQLPDGSFIETKWTNVTLDHKMDYKPDFAGNQVSIGMTALILVVLHESLEGLQGETKDRAVVAKMNALIFLERRLDGMTNPYDVAITAYALTLTKSGEKEAAVRLLENHRRSINGMYYWSPGEISVNDRRYENSQRNFILPKEPQEWDSMAVEATSYALLVFLVRDGVTLENERIVMWLQSVRDWNFAFCSPADSLVAMQALTEYTYRARLREVTNMEVSLEATSSNSFKKRITISNSSISKYRSFKIPNPWGHVYLRANGAGQALAQLEVSYGVDAPRYMKQPARKFFDLSVREHYHQANNKSRITTTVCARWVATDLSPTSHAAMVEIEAPTGYMVYQPSGNAFVRRARKTSFPQIIDAKMTPEFNYFQFEHIPSSIMQCFSFDLERWFPAANHTSVRSATIFEIAAMERFETTMLNSTSLAALDICEVCGSYQCPYCPYYSGRGLLLGPSIVSAGPITLTLWMVVTPLIAAAAFWM